MNSTFYDSIYNLTNDTKDDIINSARKLIDIDFSGCIFGFLIASIYRTNLIPEYANIIKELITSEEQKQQLIRYFIEFITKRSIQPLKNSILALLYTLYTLSVVKIDEIERLAENYSSDPQIQDRLLVDLFIWFAPEVSQEYSMQIYDISGNEDKLQGMFPTIQNFFFNLESLCANECKLLRKLRHDDKELKTIDAILRRDNVQLLEKVYSLGNFDPNQTIQMSVYERQFLTNNECPIVSYCAFYGSNNCLKSLIEKGADLNQVDSNKVTLAQFAAAGNNKEALDFLKGKTSFDGAAEFAMKYHHLDLCISLLDTGINHGLLHRAASSGFLAGIEYSLKNEDPNAQNANGRTPLMIACMYSPPAANILIERTDVNISDKEGMTALMFASQNGFSEIVSSLLKRKDIDVNMRHRFGMTALFWASQKNYLEVIKVLLNDERVDIKIKDDENWNCLHHAVQTNGLEACSFLISKGADIRCKQNEGLTPLHFAASRGFSELVKLLIQKGANPNEGDNAGMTPLLWAAQNQKIEAIEALLQFEQTDPSLCDDENSNVLHWAAQSDLCDVVHLVASKVDVNKSDNNNMTPLLIAAAFRAYSFICKLIELPQTNVNVQDPSGMTALHFAARNDDEFTIQAIVNSGRADVNMKNKSGLTPLHIAASNGNEAAVMALISAPGIDKEAKDDDGETPKMIAKSFGFTNIYELLQ
ncbi:hypothetical protein TVAG_394280 [Trichomonas vaginalis G3]|uniref:Ankyrin repeat protein n=1 Tax=Trichomonas vaginalis (strain ATCC PRA-98 / G3) TaxID=412133 RepID=A2DWE5_TRIV3|nr:spectrin binding [Trichomonas vaginalis G3]EAY15285.1 hypothetical protein TVAG_394280 [Trichomonas vaginalis G3]KAI5526396.1 spectrin binding [Trichomonas vaginalis G3]|eukprot:XP_001327508.1 hypothetical protein [Trichomonas vaginalis G3]